METKKGKKIQIIHSSNFQPKNDNSIWLRRIFSSITVEPSLLFCILPSTMYQSTTVNLFLEKTCRVHLSFNQSVCDALSERRISGYETEEAQVQDYVAQMFTISTFIQGFFPFCLILFLGICCCQVTIVFCPVLFSICNFHMPEKSANLSQSQL